MVGYMLLAYVMRWRTLPIRMRRDNGTFFIGQIFNGTTFAGSTVLLMGILDPRVLALVGNTKPFLLVAGLAGVCYSLHALFTPRDQDR